VNHHSGAYVGIDTSKLRNAVAVAEEGRGGEVRYLGEIDTTEAATRKLVAKLAAKYHQLTFCYEAGPTGYGLHRLIRKLGYDCIVAAPSLIPKKPGERVKTNRRDAVGLAKLLRAGELTAVWVPDERQSRFRKSGQDDKWSFCLTAGKIGPRIRRDDDQTSPPEPHTGLQGKGGACRHQGRDDAGPAC
jgi:transposase